LHTDEFAVLANETPDTAGTGSTAVALAPGRHVFVHIAVAIIVLVIADLVRRVAVAEVA